MKLDLNQLNPAKILLYIREDGTPHYGYPTAPDPISVAEWISQVNAAAAWIQGSPLSADQFEMAMIKNDAVRQAVRRVFGELAEDAYYLRDIERRHWKLPSEREEKLETFINSRK
jgi:hypothetical protein